MKWKVGQTVMVQSRTWANINKPGGCAKIVKVHTNRAYDNLADDESSFIEGLDVKYVLGGGREKNLDPAIVSPYEVLERGGRSRRGRDFLMQREEDVANKPDRRRGRDTKEATETKTTTKNNNRAMTSQSPAKSKPIAAAPGKENKTHKRKQNSGSGATCSSPERPKKAPKKLPKKVTPIPKVIRINTMQEKDEISPMWMDVASSSSSYTSKKQRQLDFDEKMPGVPPNALDAPKRSFSALQSKSGLSNQNNKIKNNKNTASGTTDKPDKKRKRPLLSEGHEKIISSKKKNSYTDSSKSGTRYNPSKPKSSIQPSFSRSTSVYSTNNKATTTTKSISTIQSIKKKPLLDVYRSEKDKALKFMDEMVGKDCRDDSKTDTEKPPISSVPAKSRYEEFLSHLHKVWIKIDDEEEISQSYFKSVFQEVSGGCFPEAELDTHLTALCEEGKDVMLSDGMLYRIH